MPYLSSLAALTRRHNKMLLISAAAIALAGAAGVVALSSGGPAHSQAAPQAAPVTVAVVRTQNVAVWNDFSGHLEAVDRIDIRPRVDGAIKAIHFREGALVHAGDLLVTIDPAPYEAQAASARADVAAAQARLTLATSEQARAQRLWADHAIAQSDLESKTNDLKAAEAGLDAARARLQIANLNLGYTQVRAPVSGRVGRIEVTVGNLVAAGPQAQPLTSLVSVSPIYASFDADEGSIDQMLGDLRQQGGEGQLTRVPVTLNDGGQTLSGHLQLIDNQFDSASGTLRVRAVFDNADGRLIPGQFVRVRLGEAATHPAILISELAIGTDQDKRFVYVVGKDHKVAYREVRLGASLGDGLRVVTEGLHDGDRVVIDGVQHIAPGAAVTEKVAALPAPPSA